jgi:hypothetical protein
MKKGRAFTVKAGPLPTYGCLRLLSRRRLACGVRGWVLRQPTTLTYGLLAARLVAARVSAVRRRNLGERHPAERHVSANISAANNNEMRLRIGFLSSIFPMYRASSIDPIVLLVWA